MMPWDDIVTFMGKMAQDTSGTALTFLKMMYNVGYKTVLTEFGRQVTESEAVLDLESGKRQYQVPPDCMWPKQLTLLDGTGRTPMSEVASERMWSMMKSNSVQGSPTHYHFKPTFGYSSGVLEIYPTPGGNQYDLEMVYETRDKDLATAAYNTGTVTLTNDDATVTGAGGAAFTSAMIGRYLIPTYAGGENLPYRIVAVTSGSVLEMQNNYSGETKSGASYKIVEIPNLPDDMHIIPAYFALEAWWSSQGNPTKQAEFEKKWVIGMARAKKTHAVTTHDSSFAGALDSPFPGLPAHFPSALVE